MATIINTPQAPAEQTDSNAGWAVAVIVLILVIAGGFFVWTHYRGGSNAAPAAGPTNINVTIPTPTNNGGTDAGSAPANAPQ